MMTTKALQPTPRKHRVMDKSPLKILMVAPELAPMIKVGGLADVVGALSKALAAKGHDVRIVIPKYAGLRHSEDEHPLDDPLVVNLGGHKAYARVWEMALPESTATCYLLEHNAFFDRASVYLGPSGDEKDNGRRFTFLSRAAIDLCYHLDWIPDVVHCHDWTTGLLPVYLNTNERNAPMGRAASLMTLHNMQHQGWFPHSLLAYAGLPESVYRPDGLESAGELNMLKGGIYHATKITTVSPTYAREIQAPAGGCGLHQLLRYRSGDLIGVTNGVDYSEWDPATDALLPQNYSLKDMSGKAACKAALQAAFGLEVNPAIPVFSIVSRLVDQKGLDLLAAIGDRLMQTMEIQVAVLGTGDPVLEHLFRSLAERHPGRFAAHIGFDNKLAHLSPAGADFLIMPSRFEPCGLSQLYAMIYGAPPIVRATGGLIDTVAPYIEGEGSGAGFLFNDATPDALFDTIGWACATYYDRPGEFAQVQQNGMSRNYAWDESAAKYEQIYRWSIEARRSAFL
jgi:starch synthase